MHDLMKLIVGLLLWLGLLGPAQAQTLSLTDQTLTGAAMGNGYDLSNGPLYIVSSASLTALALPLSLSVSATIPTVNTTKTNWLLNATTTTTGFALVMNTVNSNETRKLQAYVRPGFTAGQYCDANNPGAMCWRYQALVDGKRHHYCAVWQANRGALYVDGILRDETVNVGGYTPSASFFSLGLNFPATTAGGFFLNDPRIYNRALTAQECVNLSRLHAAGLMANAGSLQQGLVVSLPLNNCNAASPPLVTCADASGNSNNASNDKSPPTVVVTAPPPSPPSLTGAVSMQATCTDSLTCAQVCYFIDGYPYGSCQTTAPYTLSLDTTKYLDGSHTITAQATNVGGVTSTSAGIAVTTANSITATNYYFDSVAGVNTGNCTSSAAPCQTLAYLQSNIILRGGDTVNLKVGSNFVLSASYKLCGAQVSGCTQNFYPSNVQLNFTSYGGGACNPFTGTLTTPPANCPEISIGPTNTFSGVYTFNVGNVRFRNLAVIGNQTSSYSPYYGNAAFEINSNSSVDTVIINNNYIQDFNQGVGFNFGSQDGYINNFTISNNVITATPIINSGVMHQGANAGVDMRSSSYGTIQNNVISNMNGGASQGVCVFVGNHSTLNGPSFKTPQGQTVVQFNVCDTFGGANATCGGPPGMILMEGNNALFQFNEVMHGGPYTANNGCDWDAFDFDFGANTGTARYNYAHNNWGAAYLFCINNSRLGSGVPWANNFYYYNISEGDGAGFSECGNYKNRTVGTNAAAFNNTFYAPQPAMRASGGLTTPACIDNLLSPNVAIVNNICIMTDTVGGLWMNAFFATNDAGVSEMSNAPINNNLYWATNGGFTRQIQWGHTGVCGSQTNPCSGIVYGPVTPTCATQSCTAVAQVSALFAIESQALVADPLLAAYPTIVANADGLPNHATGADICYSSGVPAGPQPCPSSMQLTAGSPAIGKGANVNATYGYTTGTRDYYGTTLGNGVGSGYNIGADGAHH